MADFDNHSSTPHGLSEALAPDATWERRLSVLLQVSNDLARRDELPVLLHRIVEVAVDLIDAKYGALGVIGRDRGLEQFVHVGVDSATVDAIGHLPRGKGLLGALIEDPRPVRLQHLSEDRRSVGFPAHHPPMDSFLGVPIQVGGEVFGNLYLCESRHGHFTAADEELALALAASAGVAIENARLIADRRALALFDERARIARDLHDHVIQRLFAAGLNLQAAASALPRESAEIITAQVAELDAAIAQIRETIYALRSDQAQAPRLRGKVLDAVNRVSAAFANRPEVSFVGPVDILIDGDLADDVVAVVTEAVSNAARHAGATVVAVNVSVDGEGVTVTVRDDGAGMDQAAPWSGLANLADRAVANGGSLSVEADEAGGTCLRWSAQH